MKYIFIITIICLFVACKHEQPPKDYAVIHGKITNPKEEMPLRLYDPVSSESIIIEVDKDGTYRDTVKLDEPAYLNAIYLNVFNRYLANDMDIEVNFDGSNISKTLTYQGKGSVENDFLKYKFKKSSDIMG